MQHDVGGDVEFVAMMIAGTIHEQQDELPGILLGECRKKNREALRVGRRNNKIAAGAALRAAGAIQIDVLATELTGALVASPHGEPSRAGGGPPGKGALGGRT